MNYKYLSDIYAGENEFRREKMQFFFDKSFREKDEVLLRSQYIALRQLQFAENFDFTPESINISSLAESITIACDILATGTGVNFIFCGEDNCCAIGNERLITKALLNLLSNAYLYGKENLVTIKCVKSNIFTKLEVLNGGTFQENEGNGLSFIRKCAQQMNGSFFIEQTLTHTKAIMILNSSSRTTKKEYDFFDYINDRLSPVCVEMFGMKYNE